VVALDLTAAGLSSSSGPPPDLALLPALAQLLLRDNQRLSGVWPETLLLPALSVLEVQVGNSRAGSLLAGGGCLRCTLDKHHVPPTCTASLNIATQHL
jgi:hypothetical protein